MDEMKRTALIVFAILTSLVLTAPAGATEAEPSPRVLFTNVHVFDGKAEKRIMNANVLVEGNLIKQVSPTPISAKGAKVIDQPSWHGELFGDGNCPEKL
jgi:hypothetical protein